MDQLRRPEAVSRELTAASFGFFSSEEVRTRARTPCHAAAPPCQPGRAAWAGC